MKIGSRKKKKRRVTRAIKALKEVLLPITRKPEKSGVSTKKRKLENEEANQTRFLIATGKMSETKE